MTVPRPQSHADIVARAAVFLLAREEPSWSEADQAELDAWLAQSAAHEVAYLRLEHEGWARADRVTALASPKPHRLRARALAPWAIAAGVAAVVLVAGGAWLLASGVLARKTYVTVVGGRETVPLNDGTRVELNTDTRLRTQVTAGARAVWLDRGEAYFEVKHDSAHPFVVYAGDRKVTVLGTKFSVRRYGDDVRVAVVEGRVRVAVLKTPNGSVAKAVAPQIITRGDEIAARGASTIVEPRSIDMVNAALSWRQGMLTFDQTTLNDAAADFNHYNQVKLIIGDKAAAETRIGGVFKAEDADAFARLLQEAYGLKVERRADEIRISS